MIVVLQQGKDGVEKDIWGKLFTILTKTKLYLTLYQI